MHDPIELANGCRVDVLARQGSCMPAPPTALPYISTAWSRATVYDTKCAQINPIRPPFGAKNTAATTGGDQIYSRGEVGGVSSPSKNDPLFWMFCSFVVLTRPKSFAQVEFLLPCLKNRTSNSSLKSNINPKNFDKNVKEIRVHLGCQGNHPRKKETNKIAFHSSFWYPLSVFHKNSTLKGPDYATTNDVRRRWGSRTWEGLHALLKKKVSPHLATRIIFLSFYSSQNSSQNALNLYLIRRWDDSCGDSFSTNSLSFFAFFQDKFRGSQPGSSIHYCSFFNLRDARKFRIDHSLASLFFKKTIKIWKKDPH